MGFLWPDPADVVLRIPTGFTGGTWQCERRGSWYHVTPKEIYIAADANRVAEFVFNRLKPRFGLLSPAYLCVEVKSSDGWIYRRDSLHGATTTPPK